MTFQAHGVMPERRGRLWLQEPAFLHVLESADVDVSNKFDLFDVLDAEARLASGLKTLNGFSCTVLCLVRV